MDKRTNSEYLELFSSYMKLVGVPHIQPDRGENPVLAGKKLGLINSGAWIQLWSYYFGRQYLPGVKLINVGNEAVQLNFMKAHAEGRQCPPKENIELYASFAKDLVELFGVDAILVTCSTMNRSFSHVEKAVEDYGVPVIQIDQPMMEKAVENGGRVLIIATHGPTVDSTRKLLEETAARSGKADSLEYTGATIEEAFELLGDGKIAEHNELIAQVIREEQKKGKIDQVVLAQLSMSIFKLSYPDDIGAFGIPILTSGEQGFKRVRQLLGTL